MSSSEMSGPADEADRLLQSQRYDQAAQVWIERMRLAEDVETLSRCKLGYCDVLGAQQRYPEALAILTELYEEMREPVYLHRLGRMARDAGDLQAAQRWLQLEQDSLNPHQQRERAANTYERGRLALARSRADEGITLLRQCILQSKTAHYPYQEGVARRTLGDLALSLGEPDLARYYFASARDAFELAGDVPSLRSLDAALAALP